MSKSYELLIDAAVEALRSHVLPSATDDFARGQLFSVIFALNFLKSAGDWRHGPLLAQVRIQDTAFDAVAGLACDPDKLALPAVPRFPDDANDAESIEVLRDEGDRLIGAMLAKLVDGAASIRHARDIETILRHAVRDQLKIEMELVPKSMLNSIATGEETR